MLKQAFELLNQLNFNSDQTTYNDLVGKLDQLKDQIQKAENNFEVDHDHKVLTSRWDIIAGNIGLPSKDAPFYPFYTKPKEEYRKEISLDYYNYLQLSDPIDIKKYEEALKTIKKEIMDAETGLNLRDRSLWNEICQEIGMNPNQF